MAILVFSLITAFTHTAPVLPRVDVKIAPSASQTSVEIEPEPAVSLPSTPEATSPPPSSNAVTTPTPTLKLTPTPAPSATPTAVLNVTRTPTAVSLAAYNLTELKQYALLLINQDREKFGLLPVELGDNAAAQAHAEDMLKNNYLSHWGTDGLKPYMRYTLAGGFNYEAENAFIGYVVWSSTPYQPVGPKSLLVSAEEKLMASLLHRANILDEWHRKVNLGIAYAVEGNKETLALVQQFEGDYVKFSVPPTLSGGVLSLAGNVTLGTLDSVDLYYDPPPQPLTPETLSKPPYDSTYSLGIRVGSIVAPPPPGFSYINPPSDLIEASSWEVKSDGSFIIEADVKPLLKHGPGVYTVVLWVEVGEDVVPLTNYSLFVKK